MELESTRGAKRDLSALRGRAVVVFYASYGHSGDNEALKRACGRLAERLPESLCVLGVANLRGLDLPPIGRWVRRAVRRVAESYGVELWMDFAGTLQEPPLALGAKSSVAVIAPNGEILFRTDGLLREPESFYAALDEALGRVTHTSPPQPPIG